MKALAALGAGLWAVTVTGIIRTLNRLADDQDTEAGTDD